MKNSYYVWLKTQIQTYVTILFMYIIVNKGKSPSIKTCNIKHGVAVHLPPPPPHPSVPSPTPILDVCLYYSYVYYNAIALYLPYCSRCMSVMNNNTCQGWRCLYTALHN